MNSAYTGALFSGCAVAWTTWLAGVLVLAIRLIVGSLSLGRLVRRSSEVSREVAQECRIRHGRSIEDKERPLPTPEGGVVALIFGEVGIVS